MSTILPLTHQGPRQIDHVDGLYVLYKPCGIPVHATQAQDGQDLMSLAITTLGLPEGLSPIHRLDIETSGLVLCSADAKVRGHYGYLFSKHQTTKRYLALVQGITHAKGIVRKPLQDGRRGRELDATSRYKRIEHLAGCTLVEVRPETGRKHQIRRHMQSIGHAVIGDTRYRPKRFVAVPGFPGRLWLHAHALELDDGQKWSCPLPDELEAHLTLLRTPRAPRDEQTDQDTPPSQTPEP